MTLPGERQSNASSAMGSPPLTNDYVDLIQLSNDTVLTLLHTEVVDELFVNTEDQIQM